MTTTRSLQALAALLMLIVLPIGAATASGYYTQVGKIYDSASQEVQLRGVSHFGFNADILQPEYLWSMGWKEQIAQIKSLGFNAVRVPFVPDTLYVTTTVDHLSWVEPNKNADLLGKTPLQVLDLWMAEADRQGLYILLDFHSVAKARQYPTWFVDNPADYAITYNGQAYTEDNWVRDLKFVAQRYAGLSHFIGIDIYNEPNGKVRWSTGDANMTDAKYFWKPAIEKAAAGILASNPNLLIFVQGINGNWDGVETSNIPMNYGEDLQPQAYQPLAVADGKLVLSPHTYGPDVYVKSSFGAANYPANLAADWETLFGKFQSQYPVVAGEWGGRFGQGGVGQADVAWQNAFVDYLQTKNIHSSFYWCYTPNSGDTGGILDDNLAVRQDKMTLLQRHWNGASPATLALSAASYSAAQAAGTLTVSVNRSGSASAAASVSYATANGTASAGTDYTAKSGNLTWVAGDATAKSFSVPVSNASPFTGSRSFTITLSNAGAGTVLGAPASATATINGGATVSTTAGSVALSAAAYTVAQNAGSVSLTVNRTGGTKGAISVGYATASGVARSGIDYVLKRGVLNWAAGDATAKSFAVYVSNTTPFAGSKSFNVNLSGTSGGVLIGTPRSATVTINGSKLTAPVYAQPTISAFSPVSGAVGTVVTLAGSGFTGSNAAWVGNGHDASLTVVSDTQARVTVPADATLGAIVVLNPSYSASSPGAFTVTTTTTPPPPATYPHPYIAGFAPASGPVGTVVTLTGSGFTGLNVAWVGAAHNAGVAVLSDTQVNITIPAGATTGAIGLLNPSYASFSASSFTVAAGSTTPPPTQPPYLQPAITGFSPASGPVGTVVTVSGSGFTGANAGWVGNGHDAAVTVISATQASVTVPADASSGVIVLLNPSYSATSAGSFTVTTVVQPPPSPPPSPPPPPPLPPPSGTLSLRISGNHFIDTAGATVQLRGANYSGFEFAAIGGWSGSDPSGGQAGQANGPKWSAMQTWKINTVRIPLNEASWLGYSCTDTSGVVRNPDPAGNYKTSVQTQVAQATAAGIYVILDLHWTAPGNACPMLQTQMADADHSLAFWTSVATMFKNNPAVAFELFNEPFMNFDFSGDIWSYMMKGTNGSFSGFPATGGGGVWKDVKTVWAIASYQAMLNTVRATGATNVILVGTMQYAQDLSGWLANRPSDPLNQMGAAWHPYRLYNSAWNYAYPNFYPAVMTDAQAILAAGIPLVMTEVGGQNTAGTSGSPIITTMTTFADANGIGVIGWTWDVWGDPENVLIKDVNGTPTDGYGQTFRAWLLAH